MSTTRWAVRIGVVAALLAACTRPRVADTTPSASAPAPPSPPPAPPTVTATAAAPAPPPHPIPDTEEGRTGLYGKPRRPPKPPRAGYPLKQYAHGEDCVTAQGERGFRDPNGPRKTCYNPCPVGMAADANGYFCERICRTDADCEGRGACAEGLCYSTHPTKDAIFYDGWCRLLDGRSGAVGEDGLCRPHCKLGLIQIGGTDCVKPCKSNADCPGGQCTQDNPNDPFRYCGPAVCPSEGCPYPWE